MVEFSEVICKILFKFQANQMKIEVFRNTFLVVDLGPMLTFWSMLTSKIIGWLNSVTWNINPLQISSQSDENWGFQKSHLSCWPLAYVDLLTSKTKGFFLMTNSTMWWSYVKISFKFDLFDRKKWVNWYKNKQTTWLGHVIIFR